MPKVSVNIPCYNSGRFIKETLESVLAQTYGGFEVIVLDDGSTDDTAGIVKSFSDTRIKYFYQENAGLAETRNKAIALSSGEYIAFLDHDDLWLPEKLEKQMDFLEKNTGTGLLFSDFYLLKDGRREKTTYFGNCAPKRGHIFENLLFDEATFICISTTVMRRDIFDKIGYFKKEFKSGEECDLFLRVAKDYELDYIDEPLAAYRLHPGNFSNRKEIYIKEAFDILRFWEEREPELFARNTGKILRKKANIFADAANFYALNSKKDDAMTNFKLSLENYRNNNILIKKYVLSSLGCTGYKIINSLSGKVRDAISIH